MPQVSVSPAKRHAQQTALERIRRLSCAGLDVAGFLNEVNPIMCQLVPNGTETIDSPFWFTLDPESHLVTSIYGQGCDVDPSDYMRWELDGADSGHDGTSSKPVDCERTGAGWWAAGEWRVWRAIACAARLASTPM